MTPEIKLIITQILLTLDDINISSPYPPPGFREGMIIKDDDGLRYVFIGDVELVGLVD